MATTQDAVREDAKEAKGAKEAGAPEAGESAGAGEAAPKSSGGLKPWLPLLVAVVTMPLLAFATTRFVLLPRMTRALGSANASPAPEAAAAASSAASSSDPGKTGAPGVIKVTVPLNKLLVNVAGTMGTRYLMTSVTLVGNTVDFKDKIENNKDQLMDLATGALSSKTIADLEKPGARNVIRSELLTVLNNALGGPVIQEIYITELAIQ
jgi:flagellar protein FliL